MELYVISDPEPVKNEAMLINGLFEAGLQVFHLRKPFADRKDYADLLKEIDEGFWDRVALHQHHELAADFGIGRLHYPERMRMEAIGGSLLGNRIRSTSLHELSRLNELKDFEYTFFGPVFDSLSKPGYKGIWNASILKKTSPLTGMSSGGSAVKIIAIGGVDSSNAADLSAMGFDGLALLGAIWQMPSKAIDTFKNIRALC